MRAFSSRILMAGIVLLAAVSPAPASPAASPTNLSGSPYLTPLESYQTRCMGLYDTVRFRLDGKHWLFSEGWGKDNFFVTLDVLTGECARAGSLPLSEFEPVAFSDKYLLVQDGIYHRHSIYTKSDWQRHGTLRLKDFVHAAVIAGDTAYLLQSQDSPDGGIRYVVTHFSLPDFRVVKSTALQLSKWPSEGEVITVENRFVLVNEDTLTVIDPTDGSIRSAPYARVPEKQKLVSCGNSVQAASTSIVMVKTSCTSFLVLDLRSMTPLFPIEMSSEKIYWAEAFLAGKYLYLNEDAGYRSKEPAFFRVLDRQTGRELARQPAFNAEEHDYLFQVEGRLVWAVYSPGYPWRFDVRTFDMDAGQ